MTTALDLHNLFFGDLHVPLPIVQGGMGVGVSLSGLAAAVANEGGVGVISAVGVGMDEADFTTKFLEANLRVLRREIRKARELSSGILGINIMVALSDFAAYVRTAIEEGVDIIFSGAGLPLRLPGLLEPGQQTKLVPIVSSGRAASLLCRKWTLDYNYLPDAMVVEGPLAGGHLGFRRDQLDSDDYRLEKLVADTLAAVAPFEQTYGRAVPVIAAGGIYNGADIHQFLKLGAAGVQMGTRFVTTTECDVSDAFKQVYIACRKEDLVIIDSPVGLPGRVIRNDFVTDIMGGKKKPLKCPYRCLVKCPALKSPFCIARALLNAKVGDLADGFAFAGANAYRNDEIVSVRELMQTLRQEYALAVDADTNATDR